MRPLICYQASAKNTQKQKGQFKNECFNDQDLASWPQGNVILTVRQGWGEGKVLISGPLYHQTHSEVHWCQKSHRVTAARCAAPSSSAYMPPGMVSSLPNDQGSFFFFYFWTGLAIRMLEPLTPNRLLTPRHQDASTIPCPVQTHPSTVAPFVLSIIRLPLPSSLHTHCIYELHVSELVGVEFQTR